MPVSLFLFFHLYSIFFFFTATATTEIYTLSLHDALPILFAGVAIVALDLYAHKKTEMLAGLNMRGYRGPVAHQKQPREIRVAVIGGTRAFGLGMPASWTIATVLRQQVMLVTDQRGGEVRQVVPLTLAR